MLSRIKLFDALILQTYKHAYFLTELEGPLTGFDKFFQKVFYKLGICPLINVNVSGEIRNGHWGKWLLGEMVH